MKILVKLPTKFRKSKFFSTVDKFYQFANNEDSLHFMITLDNDDYVMNTQEVKSKLNEYKNLKYIYGDSKNKLDATNRDLEQCDDWDILILASDDTIPITQGYDDIIREKMKLHYPDTDGVLHFNDGHQKEKLNTLPIMGKKYFDRFGYVQHPGYKSQFADNEFMDVSIILNKTTYFDTVIIEHQHPDWGFGEKDYAHSENVLNYGYDYELYNLRKSINFGIKI